jgi:hypothetical protein
MAFALRLTRSTLDEVLFGRNGILVNFPSRTVTASMRMVVEMVKGEKKTSKRKFFPGYILVNMEMNDRTWHLVKGTPKVTGFVGSAKSPANAHPVWSGMRLLVWPWS